LQRRDAEEGDEDEEQHEDVDDIRHRVRYSGRHTSHFLVVNQIFRSAQRARQSHVGKRQRRTLEYPVGLWFALHCIAQ
jgi:hypothetical protein